MKKPIDEIDPAKADAVNRRISQLIKEAQRLSGDSGMVTPYQALQFLAARGHQEASAILDAVITPEFLQSYKDTKAAAAEHPDWIVVTDHEFRCTDETCTENTPDKLLAWYRDKHGAA